MSKNATRKRREKQSRRNQMSSLPSGAPLSYLVSMITPAETPFLSFVKRQKERLYG